MAKGFLPYSIDQRLLLPPDMRGWLPEGHLALFVSDAVDVLDLSAIYRASETGDDRGRAGYHPAMMVKLLVYGYCIGLTSSRRIERATYEDVAFRVLSGDQHPDHDCVATFRKRHLALLAGLFSQVLRLCRKAGLVKLGHVAIDGTKVGANASKHKAMSYDRMGEAEKKLEEQVRGLLEEAPAVPDPEKAKPAPKSQRNFTDPESRVMPDGANKGSFKQAYNAQIAVDAHAQIIVAAAVTQQANDKQQLEPMAQAIVENVGTLADVTSADAGYFSEKAIDAVNAMGTVLLVPPHRQKHGESEPEAHGEPAPNATASERMRHKLRTDTGRALYRMRKAIVEPVFGQIKSVRRLDRFVTRGLDNVRPEFLFIAMTHNLLKLFRFGGPRALTAG